MKRAYKILGYHYIDEHVITMYLSDYQVNRLIKLTLLKYKEDVAMVSYKAYNDENTHEVIDCINKIKNKYYLPTEELVVMLDIDTSGYSYVDIEISEFPQELSGLSNYFSIRDGLPVSMLEDMYFEETTEFEEPAYIKGYTIFERALCVYLKVGDSPNLSSISYSFKILNFPGGKPAIGDIECKSFNKLDLSNPSVIRHPNIPFTDERLIINIPKEREFIRFYKINTPGLDIESNIYDPELFIINNRDIKDIVLPAPIAEESEPIIDKVNDEILEYRKEIAELNEDIRCLLRIIKKYGMEDF